jgi:hypothetical protein
MTRLEYNGLLWEQAPDGTIQWWNAQQQQWWRWGNDAPPDFPSPPPQFLQPSGYTDTASRNDPLGFVAVAGGVLMVLGSFLPWATVDGVLGNQSVSGMEGDGVITVVLGLVAAALGVVAVIRGGGIGKGIGILLVAALAGLILAIDWAQIEDLAADSIFEDVISFNTGIGMYTIAVAVIVALAGGILTLSRRRT